MRSRESSDWVDCCTAKRIDELCKTNEFSPLNLRNSRLTVFGMVVKANS